MRQGSKCLLREIVNWKTFHPPERHYDNMQREQFIKLVISGDSHKPRILICPHQQSGVGRKTMVDGIHFGLYYQRPQRDVES